MARPMPYRRNGRRPFPNEVPEEIETLPGVDDDGPLDEDDLPATSFVERITIGCEETAFTGVTNAILQILAKRVKNYQQQYSVLTASYETYWRSTTSLLPTYEALIRSYEDEQRREDGWPELRRSARMVEANASVDEDELLF
ncbi:hypothetical protein PHYPSEUDO_002376 [Phytophthora pseudosyringae]|uniref:Uncharacterized protein n=1 Tax=Phytophthora pseudosyringae TaxID=221518 RepID=A0A8T1VXK4_9STRA|nr:hypothetical protein PHYPSEUDO_002376 [Phytophthora pseudosyringae]